jgi:pimeloyl-ACP methyl ester carboxylesterase
VFSHGWPLSADDWDGQMLFFGQRGHRVIAHDRRGHGRSDQTWNGNEMDTYAHDLAALFEKLDLKDAIMVGYSTGGGEVARYLGRPGAKRVAKKAALISAAPRLMLKTEKNPDIPVLVMHGDDDQIGPIVGAGPLSAKLLKKAFLKVYPSFPHGMPTTNADQINADLLAFFKGAATAASS